VAANVAEIAGLLRELSQRTALRGGSPYRAKAFARAADNLLALSVPIDHLIAEDRLQEIPGVGDAIASIIKRISATGSYPALENMRKEIPEGVLEMLTIPGLRPDKVLKLHKTLSINSLVELEEAAKAGRLRAVRGLGAALETKILQGIDVRRNSEGQRHLHRAEELLRSAESHLRSSRLDIMRVTPAGAFRRGCELVGELSLVVELPDLADTPCKISHGNQLTVYLTDARRYGITLLLATGSSAHIDQLKLLARSKGLVLDEKGLRRGRPIVGSQNEQEIYRALELPFIPPELREGSGEITRAQAGALPALMSDSDIRGVLHAHTDLSDGVDTLEAMAEATRARGYQYFGVADHSRSAHYAGGLSIDEIGTQHAEIDRLNRKQSGRFRILKGIESDILPDGSLDYPDEVLASFDFVVASVHSRFRLDRQAQTDRIIQAVMNPRTTILGHMTGRQLLRRPGYDVDIPRVLAACARHSVAVEINANPWRLDLDWRWHQTALDLGCMMSINPDAHSTREIDLMHWGVEMARKGGVPKGRVLNCLSLARLETYLAARAQPRPLKERIAHRSADRLRSGQRTSSQSVRHT
jgi:DNA polymerase (family X)